MNTGEEGLLTAPLLSVTVRVNVRNVCTCGAMNTGPAVLGNAPTLGPWKTISAQIKDLRDK